MPLDKGKMRNHRILITGSEGLVGSALRTALEARGVRVTGLDLRGPDGEEGDVRNAGRVRDAHAAGGGNRCRVTFQLTFLEANVAELADVVRLAVELGIDRVKGHHLWAHFDEIEGQSMRRDPEAVRRWNDAVRAAREAAAERPLPNGRHILLDNVFPLDEDAKDDLAPGGPCPFLGREAWISAEGRFDPCCAPDAQRRTLGDFGNLHERGLMEIWNGERYRTLVDTYRSRALCLGCNMRRPVPAGPNR